MKRSSQLLRLLLVALAIVSYCTARPNGAPSSACASLAPGHGPSTGGNTAPYTLTVTQMNGQPVTEYNAGQQLKVTMTPNSGTSFQGFLVKARRITGDTAASIGTFQVAGTDMKEACIETLGNALTHNSDSTKNGPLELTWTAPPQLAGHLEFVIAMVETFSKYWIVKATPNQVTDPTAGAVVTDPPIPVNTDPIILTDCESDSSKGCFTRPNLCTSGCEVAVTWKVENGKIRFEMSSKQDYVALGFSSDKTMGADSVVECVRNKDNGKITPGNSKNDGYVNKDASTVGISDQQTGFADGEVRCRFLHDGIDGGFKEGESKGYFLLLAAGSSTGAFKTKHTNIPLISDSEVKLSDGLFVGGSLSKPWLIKIHGAVMMIAWIACASIGILMARYYKDVWPNSTLLSQKVWFTIHRTLMASVLLLTIVGIIVIFVHVEGWSELESADPKILKAHPYVGILVTVLAIINPIMAVFRPHPGESNRVYFNWAHWGVGTLAHVVSIFTVFLGLSLPSAEGVAPSYLVWVMVAFVCFHVLVDIILEVHKCTAKNNKEEAQPLHGIDNNDFTARDTMMNGVESKYAVCQLNMETGSTSMEMQQMGQNEKSASSGETFRKMLLVIYILVVVAFAATLTIVVLSR